MKRTHIILLALSILTTQSCKNRAISSSMEKMADVSVASAGYAAPAADMAMDKMEESETSTEMGTQQDVSTEFLGEKIIKTGNISIEVSDYVEGMAAIKKITQAARGYITSENETRDNYRISNTLSVRVQQNQFDSLLLAVEGVAKRVENKNVNAQDVTEEYIDISARLKTKKEVELRYISFLKSAKTMKEMLEVENQLKNLREEIESTEGRLKYLSHQVQYSTLNITVYKTLDYTYQGPENSFFSRVKEAFGGGWDFCVSLFVGLIYLWPVYIIIGILAYFFRRFLKRQHAKKNQEKNI